MENTNGDARASDTIIATANAYRHDETASSTPTDSLELPLNTEVQESDLEREKINLTHKCNKRTSGNEDVKIR